MSPTNPLDPDFTSPGYISGVESDSLLLSVTSTHSRASIALPIEAKLDHLDKGHILEQLSMSGRFVECSCGISLRVGIIVDRNTLTAL